MDLLFCPRRLKFNPLDHLPKHTEAKRHDKSYKATGENNNMGLPEENKYIQISTYFSLFCIECNLVLFSVPHIIPATLQ